MSEIELWQSRFWVPVAAVEPLLAALEDELSVSAFEDPEQVDRWAITLIHQGRPDPESLRAGLAPLVAAWRVDLDLELTPVPSNDWLQRTSESFPAQRIGRFWVHGSHIAEPPPGNTVPIRLDAGLAFGSGEHDSTRGCLIALDQLARRRRPKRVLDLGCGAGILAIAAAKCWPTKVLAVDNDSIAVAVARENASNNRVGSRIRCLLSEGYDKLRRAGPFELIFANILADPLCEMADETAWHLAPGGVAVLSGLLDRQAPTVIDFHRRAGLRLRRTIGEGPWLTLVMGRGRTAAGSRIRRTGMRATG
ncbi:MAG: 50S ribosomal protein L11 methyltransferase [Pseudomonadota bacterium]